MISLFGCHGNVIAHCCHSDRSLRSWRKYKFAISNFIFNLLPFRCVSSKISRHFWGKSSLFPFFSRPHLFGSSSFDLNEPIHTQELLKKVSFATVISMKITWEESENSQNVWGKVVWFLINIFPLNVFQEDAFGSKMFPEFSGSECKWINIKTTSFEYGRD